MLPAALGLKNGDAKIIKNAGGLVISVFDSAMRSLIVAIYELGVEEIMVVAHLQRYTWEQGERYGQTGSETACNRERYGILPDSGGRSHGNEYISLEGLLDSKEIKSTLGEDIQIYYKNLFTDQNGWNLRNRLSHGLLFSDDFNSTVADRIFHAFMLLSQLKFERNGE